MDQSQQNQNQTLQNLVTPEQRNSLMTDLGLDSLPDDQKDQLMSAMIDSLMGRIMNRISGNLTDTDLQVLDELMAKPNADLLVGQYVASKVPNLDLISAEETERFKAEMKESVDMIKASLPQ